MLKMWNLLSVERSSVPDSCSEVSVCFEDITLQAPQPAQELKIYKLHGKVVTRVEYCCTVFHTEQIPQFMVEENQYNVKVLAEPLSKTPNSALNEPR